MYPKSIFDVHEWWRYEEQNRVAVEHHLHWKEAHKERYYQYRSPEEIAWLAGLEDEARQ